VSIRPVTPPLKLPRAAGTVVRGTDYDAAMQLIERADAGNLKLGTTPALPALILTAADGSSWRLTVGTDGVLHTAAVAR
jgi:hypothetical protein